MNKGDATSSARIRENQRRSRARRKEYVQHLEQKLRSYETLGVTATKEVQEAGRKVAAENMLLRSLLMLHGVTGEEIEEYLESRRQTTCAIPPRSSRTISAKSTSVQRTTIPPDPPLDCHLSSAKPSVPLPNQERHEKESFRRAFNLPSPHPELPTEDIARKASQAPAPRPVTHDRVSEKQLFDGQSTSCETAARIITGLREYSDVREIRSELGCTSEQNCMIKDMSIFEQLDRE